MRNKFLALLSCLPLLSSAQESYTMKFLPQLHQSQWYNATNQTDAEISVGLPVISGVSFYIYNSGFTYNSLFNRVNDSTMSINPGSFIDKLKNKNIVAFGADVSLLSFNVSKKDFSYGFSVSDKADLRFSYPKDLFKFAWYGNGAYIDQTLNIGDFGLQASWYREYALHGTKNYKKWTFGASPKLLFGKTNINVKEASLKLYTAPDYYALTADANVNVQTSGFADSADRAAGNMSFPGYAFNTRNAGLAIDLGAKYQINDEIDVAGGINNLGYINWKSNIHNYSTGNRSFTFEGFSLDNLFQGDTDFISTDQYLDSMKDLLEFEKTTSSYRTTLPVEFYLIGNYRINPYHAFGGQLSTQKFAKKMVVAATLSYQYNVSRHLTVALSYTAKSSAAFNLGGAVIARFLGMQWYFATDNWWASVKPLDSKNTNFRMGINLAFGDRSKKKSASPTPTGDDSGQTGTGFGY